MQAGVGPGTIGLLAYRIIRRYVFIQLLGHSFFFSGLRIACLSAYSVLPFARGKTGRSKEGFSLLRQGKVSKFPCNPHMPTGNRPIFNTTGRRRSEKRRFSSFSYFQIKRRKLLEVQNKNSSFATFPFFIRYRTHGQVKANRNNAYFRLVSCRE